ncbi:hypothetical protein ES704_03798 [subsurface metagenome]
MNQDQRRILGFCIDEWKSLAPLKEEISYSTLYRIAKNLCGRRLLLHRRVKGYRTTRRGIQALQKASTEVRTLEEDKSAEKKRLEEGKNQIVPKKTPVNLAPIQKLLGLSDEKINFFSSLYSPLKKIPSATHEAMVELVWAEVCDRAWPVDNFHHLNFLNFGDTFRWKTEEARFCTYMVVKEEEDISSYIIEASLEHGYSAWLRGTSRGEHIFKRKILEKPYVCLEDYQNADRDSKRAVGHLLLGRIKLDWQNKSETISCVAMVNLNPREGKTLFQKSGFDKPQIRRLIPCDFDAIQLPDLEKIGQEAIEAARQFGPLKIEKPKSDCRPYRKELIDYRNKLFTEEGQSLIDVEGLLNLARGFTGYGFSASEAIRYTLYKIALPYHTVGWLKPEWVQRFSKDKSVRIEINKESTPVFVKAGKKDLQTLKEEIRFEDEHRDEVEKLKKGDEEVEKVKKFLQEQELSWEKFNQLVLEEGDKVPSPEKAENALKKVSEAYKNIQERPWDNLANLKEANKWLSEKYITPFKEVMQQVKTWKEIKSQIWERISDVKKVSGIAPIRKMIEESALPSIIKDRLKEKINKKEIDLEKEKKNKIKELKSYVKDMERLNDSFNNRDEMRRRARDIAQDLVELDLIRREDDQFTEKHGESYALDAFDFKKCADSSFFVGWNNICHQTIDLLNGVKPTPPETIENFFFSDSQKGVGNGKMPTWKKWAWGAGIAGIAGVAGYSLLKNRKSKPLKLYIQIKNNLIEVTYLRQEGNWLLFQSVDFFQPRILKLPYDRIQAIALLKPEYGRKEYSFIRQEEEEIIVQGGQNDKKIPIQQVDKIIYQEIPSQEEVQPEISLTYPFQKPDILSYP